MPVSDKYSAKLYLSSYTRKTYYNCAYSRINDFIVRDKDENMFCNTVHFYNKKFMYINITPCMFK